jgi:hypothetical protein
METRNSYRILLGILLAKCPLGKPRKRWEGNIEIGFTDICYVDGR